MVFTIDMLKISHPQSVSAPSTGRSMRHVEVDGHRLTDFDVKVYQACYQIPIGKVSTYKSVAEQIGSPRAFRAVGSSLRKNPFAPTVPCHRVVASDLSLGGFFGSTDPSSEALAQKRSLLVSEGVLLDSKPSILAATGDEGRSARKRRRSEGRSPLDEESLIRVNSLCLHVF